MTNLMKYYYFQPKFISLDKNISLKIINIYVVL